MYPYSVSIDFLDTFLTYQPYLPAFQMFMNKKKMSAWIPLWSCNKKFASKKIMKDKAGESLLADKEVMVGT